jgi:hypothetical protein
MNSGSFLVQYPEPRPKHVHRWFFVLSPKSKQSDHISSSVCNYLVEHDLIVPELDDAEYKVQLALGSIDYRKYKLSSSISSVLKKSGRFPGEISIRTIDVRDLDKR